MSALNGVLLMTYGTPRNLTEVEPYFRDIRGGRQPSPEAVEELTERYRKVGGKTPLLEITQEVAAKLEHQLNKASDGDAYRVYIGMKHWHPYIGETVANIARDGVDQLVAIPLAPHYSQMSIGGYWEALEREMESLTSPIPTRFVESWHRNPLFLSMIAGRITKALDTFEQPLADVEVVFSAHSLPAHILSWNDPYPDELRESCVAVAERVRLHSWRFSYQSEGHTGTRWLGPDILETIGALASEGRKGVLVVPIGFVCDHLEILFDIDTEAQKLAEGLGIELRRTEMPNASPEFVEALAHLVVEGIGARIRELSFPSSARSA